MPPNGEPPLSLQTPSDHALLYFTLVQDGALPTGFWVEFERLAGQLKGPQNEHEESGRISGIWKQLSTFTNWQMQKLFVVATTLRPRRYRARYLECAIQGPTARQDADEAERARWIQVLADMLKATHTIHGPALVHQHEAPRRRSYRFRVRVFRRFLSWLALNHQQVYPLSWLQLTEYLRVKLEEPRSRAGLKNTHHAYSFLEEMAGAPSKQRFTNSQLYHVFHQELLASAPFEAGASFPGRSRRSPETSRGGPRHSSVLEDVCLVVASLSLGHAQGHRPLRHQASRRAA